MQLTMHGFLIMLSRATRVQATSREMWFVTSQTQERSLLGQIGV